MEFRNDPRAKPGLADIKCKAGFELLEAGDHANALVLFKEAIEHRPWHYEAHLGLGEAYRRLGAYAEARDAFRIVVRLDPENAEAQFKLGLMHLALKDYGLAKAKYDVLRRLDNDLASKFYRVIPHSAFFEGNEERQRAWGRGNDLGFPTVQVYPWMILGPGEGAWFQFLTECSNEEVEQLLIELESGDYDVQYDEDELELEDSTIAQYDEGKGEMGDDSTIYDDPNLQEADDRIDHYLRSRRLDTRFG